MKVVKIGYSKNEDEIKDVNIQLKKGLDGNNEYKFIKADLNGNLSIFNIIEILSNKWMDGIFVVQYQLNGKVTSFVLNEMKNDTVSEFERSLDLYEKKFGEYISSQGGMSAVECKNVGNMNK